MNSTKEMAEACEPHMPLDVHTPEEDIVDECEIPIGGHHARARAPVNQALDMEDDQEIGYRHPYPPPMYPPRGGLQARMVGHPLSIKPDPYDGKSDWPEYLIYFEQISEMYGWDHPTMAMVLGLSLRGSARSVLASLSLPQRRDYEVLKGALTQTFCPTQQIYLYQAELKSRTKKPGESLSDLGRDIVRLAKLAYPMADPATREAVAISAFLDALPGNAMETRMSVLRARPKTMLEVVALAIEVETVIEASSHRRAHARRDVHQVDDDESPKRDAENEKLRKAVDQLTETVSALEKEKGKTGQRFQRYSKQANGTEKRTCFNCGKPGHIQRFCRKPKNQGNEGGQPESQ